MAKALIFLSPRQQAKIEESRPPDRAILSTLHRKTLSDIIDCSFEVTSCN
jgi:hypothetical protein